MKTPAQPGVTTLCAACVRRPAAIRAALEIIRSEPGSKKFPYAKALLQFGAQQPRKLYPFFDDIAALLRHPNNIIQWTAIRLIANLAAVDTKRKLDDLLATYLQPIAGPVMITAANTIQGAARIARARPEWRNQIIAAILGVARARYATAECRHIACGHAVVALGGMGRDVLGRSDVQRFVRRLLKAPRPATRRKAEQLLRRIRPGRVAGA
jgi:hypothetical protein